MGIESIVREHGSLRRGDSGDVVRAVQIALQAAGYRLATDGDFGESTEYFVQQMQRQHGLTVDGVVGPNTAALLDAPHEDVVATATPLVHPSSGWPHDDTASLLAFYGKPWEKAGLLVSVPVPFTMTYSENGLVTPVRSVRVHARVAPALTHVFSQLAEVAKTDESVLRHVRHFSGSYNYRPVRGSSRLSCHAFGAALDFDAENLGMTYQPVSASIMPQQLVEIFKAAGAFWGGNYRGRKDPMHFQWAHE